MFSFFSCLVVLLYFGVFKKNFNTDIFQYCSSCILSLNNKSLMQVVLILPQLFDAHTVFQGNKDKIQIRKKKEKKVVESMLC